MRICLNNKHASGFVFVQLLMPTVFFLCLSYAFDLFKRLIFPVTPTENLSQHVHDLPHLPTYAEFVLPLVLATTSDAVEAYS